MMRRIFLIVMTMHRTFPCLAWMQKADTLSVGLLSPPFPDQKKYDYPGRKYDGYFGKYNKDISYELGSKNDTDINFIQLKAGPGNIYLHLAPLTFSNYFLLHGQNINYYNKMLSLIPKDTKKVVWDEYFLYKRISLGNRWEQRSIVSIDVSKIIQGSHLAINYSFSAVYFARNAA